MLSRGYVFIKPVITAGESAEIRIIAIHCNEDDFVEWVKSNSMKGHDYLIPDFFLIEYLYLKGITTTVEELMKGGELSPDEKMIPAILLEKTGAGYSLFFLISRVKSILEAYKLPYADFIDSYCEHLKTI